MKQIGHYWINTHNRIFQKASCCVVGSQYVVLPSVNMTWFIVALKKLRKVIYYMTCFENILPPSNVAYMNVKRC
jgi:hypothetical protein